MAAHTFTYHDEALEVGGDFPEPGDTLPSFMLVDEHFRDMALERFLGRVKLVVSLLSLDADQCGLELLQQLRHRLEHWPLLQFIVITVDSPFSLHRARKEHGLPQVVLLSTLRGRDFHKYYGVLIQDYPLAGVTCPALWLADEHDRILYSQRLEDADDEFSFPPLKAALQQLFASSNSNETGDDAG